MTVTEGSSQSDTKERGPHPLKRLHTWLHRHPVTGAVTKIVLTIVGTLVILAGIVLAGPGVPGPGFLVILAGLAILATEYDWADRLLKRGRDAFERARDKARAMDPGVRRRRIALGLLVVAVVVGGATAYIWAYDWPDFAIDGWDWLQGINGAVPELPGM